MPPCVRPGPSSMLLFLRRVVGDPALPAPAALLLGIAGDARRCIHRGATDAALVAQDPTNVGALLAADLELRGASRLAWVEDRYPATGRAPRSRCRPRCFRPRGFQANSGGADHARSA